MENNFWKTFAIILIAILVVGAVIVFWRNPELSPNAGVIKVQQSKYGPEVYTKAEIDGKFVNYTSVSYEQRKFILERLNKCKIARYATDTKNCNSICNSSYSNHICISAEAMFAWKNISTNTILDYSIDYQIECSDIPTNLDFLDRPEIFDIDMECICCSP